MDLKTISNSTLENINFKSIDGLNLKYSVIRIVGGPDVYKIVLRFINPTPQLKKDVLELFDKKISKTLELLYDNDLKAQAYFGDYENLKGETEYNLDILIYPFIGMRANVVLDMILNKIKEHFKV